MITIKLNLAILHSLNLTPVTEVVAGLLTEEKLKEYEQNLQFEIDFPRDPTDPRELSEIPEIRLWFIRLDTVYPWLPFLLDWKSGELVRYVAMLVPHQFHRTEGIQFNPEALEIFLMHKLFYLSDWLKQYNISSASRLKAMAQLLGYELTDDFLGNI